MTEPKPAAAPAAAPEVAKDPVDAIADQWFAVRPALDTAPMAVFGRIFRIAKAMAEEMDRAYSRYGIVRGEFDVIATLRRSGSPYTLSPRQLSATLMLTTGGMTGRLDKLEKAGLLCRKPDPHDRRGLQVTITDRGLGIVDEAVEAGLNAQRAALTGLDEAEVATLTALLRKVLAGVP
ncbi:MULTISPECIES: MarR family transcriptional regulator [unclassified Streptomyces]|uniref:MarR family winged helix-turn-helix transcriptional regulator n=1 Tax=unclassified Streptomyces TaxID=2593676 RepID=UPI000DC7908C|nr:MULTISPECIES: MarR family transcriptional regulator [unclassified Streptomyces]AWZ09305.1 MarR family transcriptional regulator [Streptomyces sp. ICC4]AWZ17043.1 MarR family transcriptional regulator [Streptomyces sp. ICC1]